LDVGKGHCRTAGPAWPEAEFDVVDVGELDLQVVGAAAAVLEVDLLEAFGSDGLELLFGGAG
jgi:hypothetical protein